MWTWLWAGMTLLWLAAPVTIWTGIDPVRDNEAATGGLILAVVTGALTACGVMRLRMLNLDTGRLESSADPAARNEAATPWTAVVRRPTLPGPQSAARAPMRRLAEAETTLAELLSQLSNFPDKPTIAFDWVEHTWQTASQAAGELRAVAARLEAVERAVDHAPPSERQGLNDGLRRLSRHLDRGLDAYRRLIAAASNVLIATTSARPPDELIDATDHLAGLAEALHELSQRDQDR